MQRLPLAGLIHLIVTYVVWGSTYLAIRVAVREGAGWGPFWLGASRVLLASAVLLGVTALLGRRVRPSRGELGILVASGLLMWAAANGGVNWAEQRVDSGLVALVVGTSPMWAALIEALLDRRPPSPLLIVSILTGFAGLATLVAPMLTQGLHADAVGVAVVVAGTFCWSAASVLVSRRPPALHPVVTSGWQHLCGGGGFLLLVLATHEPLPRPGPEAWAAWGYLVVFGSLLAFTSYVYALRLLPTAVVMTTTYVNPVIAVLLGWLILGERITPATTVGMALIVVGVVGVFRDRRRRPEALEPTTEP